MADLYWSRLMAGTYETQFYANGYKYRIEKDENYGVWRAWYIWDKSTEKKWKRLRSAMGCETLKEAKRYCQSHSARPRGKWKCVGKETEGKYAGYYKWYEYDRNGEPYKYRTHYIKPEDFSTNIDDEGKGEVA